MMMMKTVADLQRVSLRREKVFTLMSHSRRRRTNADASSVLSTFTVTDVKEA